MALGGEEKVDRGRGDAYTGVAGVRGNNLELRGILNPPG